MQIKQLEALVNVIDFGSFSKAAEATYLSQPTISSHIRTLEREVGTKLVVRSTKEIYPSHAGKVLYEYAKEILKLRERALLDLNDKTSSISGTLQIAVSLYPSQYYLPEFLGDFCNKYEELSYNITNYTSVDVAEAILNSEAEIGLTDSDLEKRNVVFEPIADIKYVLIVPDNPTYRELKEQDADLKELLKSSRFIVSKDGSILYRNVMRYVASIDLERRDLNVIASMDNVCGIVEAVRNGIGISIVQEKYLRDRQGLIVFEDKTNNEFLKRQLQLVYHSNKPLSPAAEVFAQELKRKYITEKAGPAANI
ncbi:MAG: selenium metabolism-associated LysR family transcriptional regulator [Bacillota bacterium]|nr:selenium metabolism-associated LysR family transcriptional regulator [Bacillota bacterium]